MRKSLEILAFILIGASLAIIAASCASRVTSEDLRAYYGCEMHIQQAYHNDTGQFVYFETKTGSRDYYWLVKDTVKSYIFNKHK